MTTRTREDLEAARLLLGGAAGGPMHSRVYGLPGADLCIHALTGSGIPIAEAPTTDAARAVWAASPYRHHVYTPADLLPRVRQPEFCECGNSEPVQVHQKCWE